MSLPFCVLPPDQIPNVLTQYIGNDVHTKVLAVFDFISGKADPNSQPLKDWIETHRSPSYKRIGMYSADKYVVVYADLI
jgi:hypothetical protein